MSADAYAAVDPEGFVVDVTTLDRLVDGSLEPAARRRVLEALDCQADGWRRCALAFLEAQAWRETMTDLGDELRAETPAPAVNSLVGRFRPRPSPRLALTFARAAGLLLAFGLGWLVARDGPHRLGPIVAGNSEQPIATKPVPEPTAIARTEPTTERSRPEVSPAPGEAQRSGRPALASLRSEVPPDLPADGIPTNVRKQMAQRGFQLEPASELATVAVGAGRKLSVPVNGVRIRYVGNRTY